jgi:hypothetical protein
MRRIRPLSTCLSLLSLFACLSLQAFARQQSSEGTWISYYSSSHVSIRLNLGVQYYGVRFTKPADWPAVSIDSVKVVWESSAGRTVKLCFWKNYTTDTVSTWPVDPPLQSDSKTIYVSSDTWNTNSWSVSALNWSTDEQLFFVGIEQIAFSSQLCSDGMNQPENRSYRRYSGQSWTREYGMMANYCIAVYASKLAATSVHEDAVAVLRQVELWQNYPNPFNPSTTIRFALPRAGHVALKLYGVLGQEVADLVDAELSPGLHSVQWNSGSTPSGVYFYRLQAGNRVEVKSMMLLR